MLQTVKRMTTRYNDYMTYVGRKRACEVLLRNSDRMLEDAGFSRELLEAGADAWPWQITEPSSELKAIKYDKLPINRAINDLKSNNDQNLNNASITSGVVSELKTNDNVSVEHQEERKVA